MLPPLYRINVVMPCPSTPPCRRHGGVEGPQIARSYTVSFECLHVASGLLCTSKHRLCDTAKAKLVRYTPETFKGLGLSQQSASCHQKAMLAVLNHSEIKLNADTSRLKSSITTYCPFANSIHFPSP